MKQIFILLLIANSLTIVSLYSCGKENLAVNNSPSSGGSSASPFSLSLVADRWTDINGVYIDNFKGILPTVNVNGKNSVKIYLVENQEEILINNAIHFMGNELWAENIGSDISIHYRCDASILPFDFLEIKVKAE